MKRARGFALITLLGIASLMSALILTNMPGLPDGAAQARREQREVLRGLREARLALMAHALIEDNTPGTLPSASAENALDGRSSPLGFTGTPGIAARRLPWHFLALPARVGGECLWYAVSAGHRNSIGTHQRKADNNTLINPANAGLLEAGAAPSDKAVAVLVAPGRAASGQARGSSSEFLCADGPVTAFLEFPNDGRDGVFAPGDARSASGDTVLALRASELMRAVIRRVLASLSAAPVRTDLLDAIRQQTSDGTLSTLRCAGATPESPCPAAPAFDALVAGQDAARLVYRADCPGLDLPSGTSYRKAVSWLCFNDWYAHIRYQRSDSSLDLAATTSSARPGCRLFLANGQIICEH